ncbi:hypothetical protein KUTeg_001705 [Tegillarca granosa]|uniref:Ran guanine nucleotide release factor n=1 Tax=Tegillarca granosa TaxID=220873 RepID=A0ABQ9FS77_TEGGR|nr:hypothetical protein KUTeg_001705 [Tegillarca granosa]
MAERTLFGGALSAVLPPGAADVSQIRQIPDNQEVFTHSQTDQSLIIEILEMVQEPDESAIKCSSAWYVLGQQNIAKYNEAAKNQINIHMGLFRLPDFTTDILITFNDPVIIDPASSSNQPVPVSADRWMVEDFKQVLCSMKITDPSIFGV